MMAAGDVCTLTWGRNRGRVNGRLSSRVKYVTSTTEKSKCQDHGIALVDHMHVAHTALIVDMYDDPSVDFVICMIRKRANILHYEPSYAIIISYFRTVADRRHQSAHRPSLIAGLDASYFRVLLFPPPSICAGIDHQTAYPTS